MKFCSNCGKKIENEILFCPDCGASLKKENKIKEDEGLATMSIIIGAVSLVLSLVLNVAIMPLAIIGIILWLASKTTKKLGLVLNTIAIIVGIVVIILLVTLFAASSTITSRIKNRINQINTESYVQGNWNCKSFDGSGEGSEYIVSMKLNKNGHYVYGKYGDLENNSARGTYEVENLKKKNHSGDYKYYLLKLKVEDYYEDGNHIAYGDEGKISKFEIGITETNNQKHGILIGYNSYNMYYCYNE